jgi:hypothetical protein
MKRMAFALAVIAMVGCKKAEPPASSAGVPDTSSAMMAADTSHMMMSDTSKMMMGAPKK